LRSFSLLRRLVLAASLLLVIALGLVGLALNSANYRGAVSSLQVRMELYVYQVLAAMEIPADRRLGVEENFADPRLTQPGSGVYIQVLGLRDRWQSASAIGLKWPEQTPAEPGQVAFHEPGSGSAFFALHYGVGWELVDGTIEPFTLTVLVDQDELEKQTSAFRMGLWRSLGSAGAILLLAQIAILFLGFRPLRRVAADVARVESGESPRLPGGYPVELEPLARNVNRLLETEKSNQSRIRNALDSLAHSLKTPLAVIQAGAAADDASMQNAVDEMSHLIATRLERAGSSTRRTLAEPVAVEPQLRRIFASMQKIHSHKLIQPGCTLEENLAFYGEQRDLLELMGNLVDNAFKYGKSRVLVSAGPVDSSMARPGLWLRVEDDGPGIDTAQWAKLLQRGTRGDEQVEGHGLGLAIVMELVTAYGGEVSIGHSDLGGAMISVKIPAS
jgi:two-component system sensor histidine kinase PhoQ